MHKNPESKELPGYYRLLESYRNHNGQACHRTMLSVGFLDVLSAYRLNATQKTLTAKVANLGNPLFKLPYSDDLVVLDYVERFFNRMVVEKRINIPKEEATPQAARHGKDYQRIDINSIHNKNVREIDAEWLSYQAVGQLRIASFLEQQGWDDSDIRLAMTHIISRVVYPASELKTSSWKKRILPYAKSPVLI